MSTPQQPTVGRASQTTEGCSKNGMTLNTIFFIGGLGLIVIISILALLSYIPSISILPIDLDHVTNIIIFIVLLALGLILMVFGRKYTMKCKELIDY